MNGFFELASANLLSPMVLFFALGLTAAWLRSDLTVPESIAKFLSLYLMLSIGFKGGASVAANGIDAKLGAAIVAGIALSALIPFIGFWLLKTTTRLSRVDMAAIAAHYGSISIVTLLAGIQAVTRANLEYEGYIVAVAAAMETPAIMVALWLAAKGREQGENGENNHVLREVFLNGSIVVLIGSFLIGWMTGKEGLTSLSPFIVDSFKGFLCLFLLDMGLVAGRGMRDGSKNLSPPLVLFGLYMPLIGGALGLATAHAIGMSVGGTALFTTLAASASYIAVPAALRLALPEAKPSIYLPLSLGITFPFNLTLGLPLYIALAQYTHS